MDQATIAPIEPLVGRIRKQFAPARVILFGSRARGDAIEDSDYDLLIISPRFKGTSFYQRMVRVNALREELCDIDVICLTPEEFKARSHELSIIGVAAKEGKEIVA